MSRDEDEFSITFLRLLLIFVGGLSVLLVLPYLQAILAAGLAAYLAVPLSDRLSERLGGNLGALTTMVVTVLVVLVPVVILVGVAADQAISLVRGVEIPQGVTAESVLEAYIGMDVDMASLAEPLTGAVETGVRGVLGRSVGILGGLTSLVISAVVFLFTLFALLRDGDRLVGWLRSVAPLDPATMDELLERTDDLLWAAVVGNVIVAAIQAALTVLAFAVLGFDDLVFWAMTTFVLSLLPLIGASIVWIPAVAYLALVGSIPAAVGLFVYGSVVISGSDNFIRPLAMQRGAKLNSGLLVLGIFGGVSLFGFIGLFVGPVLLGLSKDIVELLAAERRRTMDSV
ncbi:AI-2E family transporter [Halobacterium wangiae]|uniref:AI-2E family transporter n=1 Tax=Halobacterium wangiae TaxID=2902623 RepID=UPI001E552C66|nr:AI-2E family transporter [Halobacterium wangiae]